MAGSGFVGRGGGAEGAHRRRPRRRDHAAEGEGRRDDHGDRAVAGEDRPPGGRRPFGTREVEAMSRAVSPSVDRVYGLVRVARCWNVSRATVYRHRQAPAAPETPPRSRGTLATTPPCCSISGRRSPRAASPTRATARSGRDCALPAPAPRPAGCGG